MRVTVWKILAIALVIAQFAIRNVRAQQVADVSHLALPGGALQTNQRPQIFGLRADIQVAIKLSDPSLAQARGKNAKQLGSNLSAAQQRQYVAQLGQKQDALMAQVRNLGGREIGRLAKAHNAVIVAINPAQLPAVTALPGVVNVRQLHDYALNATEPETVPYIGATAVQLAGITGAGIRVAVLDTGIDYTHKLFGGAGTAAAYQAAYGTSTADPRNTTTDGLFPTNKVIGGFDFVGEQWPNGPLAPDPDPIDCGPSAIPLPCAGGHGTHVADIIAGNDGASHKGVAPDVKLYALKVCSTVSTSCSGVALLQAMEFALDPDGDGDISDAVDVINMSLGSSYGQIQDDLSEAASDAVQLGVVVVAAAANSGDLPYVVSSPSISPETISVAQTQVPSAVQNFLTIVSPSSIAGNYAAVFQPWSAPLTSVIQGPLQYGDGAGGNKNGCAAFAAGSLAGKIVLVDRGSCAFSVKISNIAGGGGSAGIIGLIAPGDPFEGAFGGGTPTIPGFMISQADANKIKGALSGGVVAKFDPNTIVRLVMSMVSTSARGPSYSFNSIKPEIGAPGASVSAEAGTGTRETSFGGTSGATPMISGSAALLIQAHPTLDPLAIKALLMNTAETNIQIDPVKQPGVVASITRIGSGEVRVNRALGSSTAAWDAYDMTPSLSFGYNALTGLKTFDKTVEVHNFGNSSRKYSVAVSFRYANDMISGAVLLDTPASVTVPAHGRARFKVRMKTDATKLPIWTLNGGSRGGDGFRLQGVEFDGYINITDPADAIHLPWHILPHRAADVSANANAVSLKKGPASVVLNNQNGAIDGRIEVFSLMGKSRKIPRSQLPGPGDNFAVIDLKSVGARLVNTGAGPAIQFGISTFGVRSHPNYPAEFDLYIDANRDGTPDYVVFNLENGGFGTTGQNVVAVANLATNPPAISIFFFTDADLDSGNAILTAPVSVLGLTPASTFDFSVFAFDNYFTGNLTDAIVNLTYTPSTPRFIASGIPATGVPAGGKSVLTIQPVPDGDTASPSQTGILLLYRDAKPKSESDAIEVK